MAILKSTRISRLRRSNARPFSGLGSLRSHVCTDKTLKRGQICGETNKQNEKGTYLRTHRQIKWKRDKFADKQTDRHYRLVPLLFRCFDSNHSLLSEQESLEGYIFECVIMSRNFDLLLPVCRLPWPWPTL